jgi:hypothetical protein
MLYRITKSRFGAGVRRNDFNADVYTGTDVHTDTNPDADANTHTNAYAYSDSYSDNSAANTTLQRACLYKLAAEDGLAVV